MSKKDIKREHNRKQKHAQRMAARFVPDKMPGIWEDIRRAVGIDVDWGQRVQATTEAKSENAEAMMLLLHSTGDQSR
jgi:hypothetical protein